MPTSDDGIGTRAHPPAQALRGCERRALSARLVRGLMVAIAAFGLSEGESAHTFDRLTRRWPVRRLCPRRTMESAQTLHSPPWVRASSPLRAACPRTHGGYRRIWFVRAQFVLWTESLDRVRRRICAHLRQADKTLARKKAMPTSDGFRLPSLHCHS
jgi:hypothetical protein